MEKYGEASTCQCSLLATNSTASRPAWPSYLWMALPCEHALDAQAANACKHAHCKYARAHEALRIGRDCRACTLRNSNGRATCSSVSSPRSDGRAATRAHRLAQHGCYHILHSKRMYQATKARVSGGAGEPYLRRWNTTATAIITAKLPQVVLC